MHYAGDARLTSGLFQEAYHEVFQSSRQRKLYENVPLVYVLDDHDAGSDNANGNSRSLGSANKAYRAVVPHYTLPETSNALAAASASSESKNLTEE